MRVLYCILDNRCGGPHRLAHGAALKLREHDIDTLFLLGHKAQESWRPDGFQVFLCRHIQAFRRRSPILNLLRFGIALPGNLRRIGAFIRSNDIDIVHIDGATNLVPALAARLTGRPVVWLYNDYIPRVLKPVLIPLLTRLASTVVVQGENIRERHTAGKPRLRDKTVVLYSAVDTRKFNRDQYGAEQRARIRQELGLPDDAIVIGSIRNLNRFKGHAYFLEAARRIKERFATAKFLIVGRRLDTDPGYWDHLQELTARLGLKDDVVYAGFRDDIPAILSALDIFVLASIEESCPVALLEAMAMEVPVVATNVGSVAEMVLDGRTGLVVPARDGQAIADAVLRYLDTPPEQVRSMVDAARKRVEIAFGMDTIARRQKELYEDLVR